MLSLATRSDRSKEQSLNIAFTACVPTDVPSFPNGHLALVLLPLLSRSVVSCNWSVSSEHCQIGRLRVISIQGDLVLQFAAALLVMITSLDMRQLAKSLNRF